MSQKINVVLRSGNKTIAYGLVELDKVKNSYAVAYNNTTYYYNAAGSNCNMLCFIEGEQPYKITEF